MRPQKPVCNCLLLISLCLFAGHLASAARTVAQPSPAADPRSCAFDDPSEYETTGSPDYDGELEPEQLEQHATPPSTAAAVARHIPLQEQMRAQQLLMNVLGNVSGGVITAAAALDLLKDVSTLRASLIHGAAAERWAKLKGRSLNRRLKQQQQKHQQQKQQGQAQDKSQQQAAPYSPYRGILIVAGRSDQFMNAFVLLQLLRSPTIGCRLPAEVVYYGPAEYDALVATAIQDHATSTSTALTIIDGKQVAPTTDLAPHRVITHTTGFKSKVHALAFVTSFEQVLLLDSDNTPLADPSYLFESPGFKATGNIMWVDFWTNQWMLPVVYSVLGLDVPWELDPGFRAAEAGQLMVDRLEHYDVLEWLWLLNTHSSSGVSQQDPGVVGKCLWGDKDTYPIAFHLAGKAHLINNMQHMPMQALSKPGPKFVHAGMVQRGLFGELLFLHRTAAGKLWPHCAAHGGLTCQVWGITTPVDQQQLVASVKDVTMMELEVSKVDLNWHRQHCHGKAKGSTSKATGSSSTRPKQNGVARKIGSGGKQAAGSEQQAAAAGGSSLPASDIANSTMLACDLSKSVGLLPIPVISADALPAQVQQMLEATFKAFLQTMQLSGKNVAASGIDSDDDDYED